MKIFLAGVETRHWILDGALTIRENKNIYGRKYDPPSVHSTDSHGGGGFLSVENENISGRTGDVRKAGNKCNCSWQGSLHGGVGGGYDPIIRKHKPYILESFYYADNDTERLLPYYGDFMLDSGAFTFMQNQHNRIDWEEYARKYIGFINRNNVQKYIELDLDYIIGVKEARKLRELLENETGKKSIPVWHPIRGKESFLEMCDEYDYVALGGIVGKKWRGMENLMPWFINEAHKRNAKIHGLGFTQLKLLPRFHFDSVDSTAWTTGNRFGYLYYFDGKTMKKKDAPKGCRIANSRVAALHNYTEWIKFQKWADIHL